MSIDSSSIQKVTSKYFSNKGMDESLSDFQEKKKISAPNSKQVKAKKSNTNAKKVFKKPRGQKDIRAALKSKTSDLVAYSKDFGNVCKQSGIDVDPEQLQLAIALSKSIQPSTSETQSSQPTSQERTARIRSTLQEYGFTVPEIKISNNKKTKKLRKKYKLLLLSEAEKQRNIADRYSQVLLQNICHPRSPTKKVESNSDSTLFYLATNVTYQTVQNNNLYYLQNLPLEKSVQKGGLLRDWSEIPGRPVSPKPKEDISMDVSEILCSQEELNVILSGALRNAKNVVDKLRGLNKNKDVDVEIVDINEKCTDNNSVAINNKSLCAQVESVITRSLSPDMFDDDHSGILDSEGCTSKYEDKLHTSVIIPCTVEATHHTISNSQLSQKWNMTRRKSNDVMELTECVGMTLNPSCNLTMKTDTTNRKSNDFMEFTECVTQNKDNIDLTQNSDETVTEGKQVEVVDSINLTQSSDSNDALPFVHVSGKNNESLNDTVVLNDSVNRTPEKEDGSTKTTPVADNNQSTKSLYHLTSETPPKKSASGKDSSDDSFFEDFLYNHSNSPEQNNIDEKSVSDLDKYNKIKIDLTQSPEYKNDTLEKSVLETENKNNLDSTQNSEVGAYINDQSYLDIKDNTEIDLTESPEYNNDTQENSIIEVENKNDIDLTQNSSTSEEVGIDNILVDKVGNKSSLGRMNNVSIDYDELSTSNAHRITSINKTNIYDVSAIIDDKETENNLPSESKSNTTNSSNKYSDNLNQNSQDSEVFEISDKELDYSMHKSRFDDCFEVDFGGISVVDDNSEVNKDNEASDNKSSSNSFLPEVNIKAHELLNKPRNSGISPIKFNDIDTPKHYRDGTNKNQEIHKESCIGISPIKKNVVYDIVKTPSNNEYIVKTDQVTPMGDYNAMTTPDRNRELDKYGLKPLKRKRAIQLLTHIYNQTHPIVQPCTSEISQSPTKKRKTSEVTSSAKSPNKMATRKTENVHKTKQISPNKRKSAISPIKTTDYNNEIADIYEVTNEIEVRNIECPEDEWVFQKREKSKINSCRVPLHIAFHNYISCRKGLREAILRYEPVEIDIIHKGLVANGCRYDPKDLLKFMDKKCITVKTADNNARNKK